MSIARAKLALYRRLTCCCEFRGHGLRHAHVSGGHGLSLRSIDLALKCMAALSETRFTVVQEEVITDGALLAMPSDATACYRGSDEVHSIGDSAPGTAQQS